MTKRKQIGFSLSNILTDYTIADNCEFADLTWKYFAVSKELLLRVRVGENSMTLILNQTSQKSMEHTGGRSGETAWEVYHKGSDLSH